MVVGLPKGGRRVLLADDDAVVQEVVRCAAAKVGHQVTAATTGARAFELAVSMQPDLIVLDIQFPDADGRDVLAQLKRDPRTSKSPSSCGPVVRRAIPTAALHSIWARRTTSRRATCRG